MSRFDRCLLFVSFVFLLSACRGEACNNARPADEPDAQKAPAPDSATASAQDDAGAPGRRTVKEPVEPADAPPPTQRTEDAPAADKLTERVESYFDDRPGRRIHIQTDKPLYRPGETIWVKSWNLTARDLSTDHDNNGVFYTLVSPKGNIAAKKRVREKGGHSTIDFEIEKSMKGGEYKLRVRTFDGHEAERPVIIANYEPPRIKKELEFIRKAYGEGDEVVATVKLQRGTDEPLAKHPVEGLVRLDGRQIERVQATTNDHGGAALRFRLPDEIKRGDGMLTVLVEDAGVTESINRRIPIVLDEMNVDFYPEGGDLVAGLAGRVYFAATKPTGKPADVEGVVEDDKGAKVAEFASFKNGLGRFSFTPKPGRTYRAKITKPDGVDDTIELPKARSSGCTLRHYDDPDGQLTATRVAVRCSKARSVVVSAFMRNNPLDVAQVDVPEGEPAVVHLEPDNEALARWQGVTRVTLFDDELEPLAERLVYRQRRSRLDIEVEPELEDYGPRDKVELTIKTKDLSGDPQSAHIAMSVVDDKVISFADDETGHLLAQLLLEPELPGEIEEPNFYLDLTERKSARALDLLMGTRGYRKFAWKRVLTPPKEKERTEVQAFRGGAKGKAEKLAENDEAPRELREHPKDQLQPKAKPPRPAANREKAVEAKPRGNVGLEADMEVAAEPAEAELAPAFDGLRNDDGDIRAGRGLRLGKAKKRVRWAKVRKFPVPDYSDEKEPETRNDFRDTVYWNPDIETGADGEAKVEFHLSDAITSFRIFSEGIGAGLAGRDETVFKSALPFGMTAKLPLEVSAGDHIELPVTLMNERDESVDVDVAASFGDLLTSSHEGELSPTFSLQPGGRTSRYFPIDVTGKRGESKVRVRGQAGGLTDDFERTVKVAPRGFPREIAQSGEVGDESEEVVEVDQPLEGTIVASVKIYPSPLSTMTGGLDGMLREPHGCFEQASSSNYPNVMLTSYLEEQGAAAPDVASRAKKLMDKGYRKLTSYETKEDGYEWFGKNPGHEALTAYGLLEFVDMKEVWGSVSQEMIDRTAKWLLSRRDGEGGFERNSRALDSFGRASPEVTNAYIVYSLTEAGYADELKRELDAQAARSKQSDDPYIVALAVNSLLNADRLQDAGPGIKKLLSLQKEDGSWTQADHSVTRSTGHNLHIETTAIATMALMKAGGYRSNVRRSIKWLNGQRGAFGKWGATQATVLTLRALTEYSKKRRKGRGPGSIRVLVDGKTAGELSYTADQSEPLSLDITDKLGAGKSDVRLVRTEGGGAPVPYTVAVRYRTEKPATSPDVGVSLTTELAEKKVAMGESVRLTATVENTTESGLGMTLARIGLPGGLTFQNWQLKELREKDKVAFYETREREVILYFRDMKPGEKKTIPIELTARIPGTYKGQASQAYLYYTDDLKYWTDPLQVEVTRK